MPTFFGNAVRAEARQLAPMFMNTLTFTVTFQAVSTLVESNNRSAPILMVAVAAIVLICVAVRPIVEQAPAAMQTLVSTALQVATQFLSNLVAVSARQVFFEVASVWWILLFSAFAVLLVDVAGRRLTSSP